MYELIRNNVVKITDDATKRDKLIREGYHLRDVPSASGGINPPPEAEPKALETEQEVPEAEIEAPKTEQQADEKPPRKGKKE